jgi:hypothetical protein
VTLQPLTLQGYDIPSIPGPDLFYDPSPLTQAKFPRLFQGHSFWYFNFFHFSSRSLIILSMTPCCAFDKES